MPTEPKVTPASESDGIERVANERGASPIEELELGPLPCRPDGEGCTPAQRETVDRYVRAAMRHDCSPSDRALVAAWLDLPIDPRATCRTAMGPGTTIVRLELQSRALAYAQDVVKRRPAVTFTDRDLRRQRGECFGDEIPYDSSCDRTDPRVHLRAVAPKAADGIVVLVVEIEHLGVAGGTLAN